MYAGVRGVEDQVPTTTSGGASNAWEASAVAEEAPEPVEASAKDAAPVDGAPGLVGREDGPELVVTPKGDGGGLAVPQGWTEVDPAAAPEAAHASRPPIVTEPVLPEAQAPDAGELSAADVAAGYTDLSFAQLRAEAKSRGLPAGGSAVDLAARLGEHDAASASAEGDAPVAGGG
jgi:hypothetical protein